MIFLEVMFGVLVCAIVLFTIAYVLCERAEMRAERALFEGLREIMRSITRQEQDRREPMHDWRREGF